MTNRLRVGVIGCGLIAQAQHLPNLRALPEFFELSAVCDLDLARAKRCAERFGASQALASAADLMDNDVDAVIISTSGDHAKLVTAAAERGLFVLVEKPLCLDLPTATALRDELDEARDRVMLGYTRRYEAAFGQLEEAIDQIGPVRVLRTRTAETAAGAYLKDLAIDDELKMDEDPMRAAGEDYSRLQERTGGSPLQARLYKNVVLDSLIHEVNMIQALAGPARSVAFADLSEAGATAVVRCERATVQMSWVATPGAARYAQEVQVLGEAGNAMVRFGSPYMPASAGTLTVEGGGPELASTWCRTSGPATVGPFRVELLNFHALATEKQPARTSIDEAVSDIALCEALGRSAVRGEPVAIEDTTKGAAKERKGL
jgi:predicted dehydrogenase